MGDPVDQLPMSWEAPLLQIDTQKPDITTLIVSLSRWILITHSILQNSWKSLEFWEAAQRIQMKPSITTNLLPGSHGNINEQYTCWLLTSVWYAQHPLRMIVYWLDLHWWTVCWTNWAGITVWPWLKLKAVWWWCLIQSIWLSWSPTLTMKRNISMPTTSIWNDHRPLEWNEWRKIANHYLLTY